MIPDFIAKMFESSVGKILWEMFVAELGKVFSVLRTETCAVCCVVK